MKTFALLDENNIVINISIAKDNWDSTGWIEYTKSKPAGIGHTYDPINDAFIAPKPECGHSELTLNAATYGWKCDNAEHEITW